MLELLIVVSIIALLTAILLPAIGRVREAAHRATDLSHLRQLATATMAYATENGGLLPRGRLTSPAATSDDYTWLSYKSCWKPLIDRMAGLDAVNSCVSVLQGYADVNDFGKPQADYNNSADAVVGWIYWGGRDDLIVDGALKYRSPRRLGQNLTPSSPTLWTCWCWDSAGNPGPSICPHVGSRYVQYASGVALQPPPDGLGVARSDGSASFVAWHDLITIPQANGFKIYYQP